MNYDWIAFIGFFILIPGFIVLFRLRSYDGAFYPFAVFIWLGCLNELLSWILLQNGFYTTVNNNIYVLLASILIIWFFKRMELFKRQPALPYLFLGIYIITWLTETFLLRSIHDISSYFRILFSFATVLMSISLLNTVLVQSKNIVKEGVFWICSGFITHFTLKVLVELFFLYGITDTQFQQKVFNILIYTNLFTNLAYALAALWINKKRPYSLQW